MAAARWSTSSSASVCTSSASSRAQLTELGEVTQLLGHDRAVLALLEDEDVHDADDAGVVEPEQLVRSLAREVLVPSRELDDEVVDGPQLVDRSIGHDSSIPMRFVLAQYGPGRAAAGIPQDG